MPVIDLSAVDATVEVVSLDTFDRTLTMKNTPDWLIYLRASQAGFDAVVTRDRSQLDDAEEMVALLDTGMNVITWRERLEDPIQEWGQLLAYMGLIRQRLRGKKSHAVLLPRPALPTRNVIPARSLLGEMASRSASTFPAIRAEARRVMTDELMARGQEHLILSAWGSP